MESGARSQDSLILLSTGSQDSASVKVFTRDWVLQHVWVVNTISNVHKNQKATEHVQSESTDLL